MSCQLKAVAKIDISNLNNFFSWSKPTGSSDDSSGTDNTREELPCLNECHLSLSPSGEVLAVAQQGSLVTLSAKWDSQEEDEVKTKFKLIWQGDPRHNGNEQITAVLCLPLILQGKTSRSAYSSDQCSLDWTCIAVGFSTGHLRFYDESGGLLLSEKVHDEPITHLKCQSYHPCKTSSYDDFAEELYVVFHTVIACIPGFPLFQTLRACRNQLARVQANCAESVVPAPLNLKKWSFSAQDKMNDCEVMGPASSNTFDHLLTASVCGGFKACYRAGAPKSTLIVAAGRGPFVGFHYAWEGVESRSVLTDVALAVTNKFKGWLRGGKALPERNKESAVIEVAETMACRFGLCDFSRQAEFIVRSPNREYSAVSDALGRVSLINNARGIVVRMWKGYRKAQCGWLQVEEEEPSKKSSTGSNLRTVLFLVIYDPKKGVLEVWPAPQGPRVAAFSCSKMGKLLYTSHGFVGLNNVAVKWANRSLSPCVFVDPKGTVFEVIVPFHCALSDETSDRAADLCLLRKLKTFLRESEADSESLAEEVGLIAAELRTTEIRRQTLTMLMTNKYVTVDALEAALVVFMDRVACQESRRRESIESTLLLSCQQLWNLAAFYKFVQQQRETPPGYTSVVPQQGCTDLQVLSDSLSASKREVAGLKSLLSYVRSQNNSRGTPRKEIRVKFQEGPSKRSALVDFLACFEVGNLPSICSSDKSSTRPLVALKEKVSTEKLCTIAELLFQGILYSEVSILDWRREVASSGVHPADLLQLAIHFWLNRHLGHAVEVEMIRFAEIVKVICTLEGADCDVFFLWVKVRNMLIESNCPLNALTAAIVCRSVAIAMEKRECEQSVNTNAALLSHEEKTEDDEQKDEAMEVDKSEHVSQKQEENSPKTSNGGEWENVSWDTAQWSLLIGRLEDIALLDSVISTDPSETYDETQKSVLPRIPFVKPVISLGSVLRKGKGAISEMVAKWLASSGLDPKLVIEPTDVEWLEKSIGSPNSSKQMDVDEFPREDMSEQGNVKEGLPLTTEQGAEAVSVSGGYEKTLEGICTLKKHFPYSLSCSTLLANLSWELMLMWHHTPDNIEILSGALLCMQTVPCVFVRQGLCCLIWSTHLKQRFEALVQLLNICNGNPKEKLCRKELEMSETQLVQFLNICVQFLEAFIEASNMSEVIHAPSADSAVKRSEDLWDYDLQVDVAYAPALTVLALQQPQAQYDQLDLLLHLALTAHMMLSLNIRSQLTPLFSRTEWAIFFADLSHPPLVSKHEPEAHLTSSRNQFLMRAVSIAMQGVLATDPTHLSDLSGGLNADMAHAMQWMGRCQELAHAWLVSVDPLRRHQVCLLYSAGHDRLAEEILPTVSELDLLASQLILIAGQRLKLLLHHSEDLTEKMSHLDPKLSHWLFDLNTGGVREVPLQDTVQLTTHIVQHLSEDHPESSLAVELFDTAQVLLTAG